MRIFKSKFNKLAATEFSEVKKLADMIFLKIKKRTKRQPYLRSKYFKRQKVFVNLFWTHLFDKKWQDRMRRLQYFEAAIDLIESSPFQPESKINPNKQSEILHRFLGKTRDGHFFCVQIKESKASKRKYLMSFFPINEEKALR